MSVYRTCNGQSLTLQTLSIDSATPGHLTINGYRIYCGTLVYDRGHRAAPGGRVHGSLSNCRGRELHFGVGTRGPVHQSSCELSPLV